MEEEAFPSHHRGPLWNSQETLTIHIVTLVSSSLSLIGSLFIICSYLIFKETDRLFQRLVLYLSFADFVTSVIWIINITVVSVTNDEKPCFVLGPCLLYFYLSSFFWTTNIATEMLWRVTHMTVSQGFGESHVPAHSSLEKYYLVFGWLGPLPFLIPVIIHDSMGNTELSCWFRYLDDLNNFIFLGIIFAVIFYCLFAYVTCTIFYAKSLERLGLSESISEQQKKRMLLRKTAFYLLIYVICWGISPPLDVAAAVLDDEDDKVKRDMYPAWVIAGLTVPLQGFLNSIVYGWNARVWVKWRDGLSRREEYIKMGSSRKYNRKENGDTTGMSLGTDEDTEDERMQRGDAVPKKKWSGPLINE